MLDTRHPLFESSDAGRERIDAGARLLEVGPGQHIRRKVVRRPASRHGSRSLPRPDGGFRGYWGAYSPRVLSVSLSPRTAVPDPEGTQYACQATSAKEVNQT
jgi:hypothetical protein